MKTIFFLFFCFLQTHAFAFFNLGTPNKSCPNGQITVNYSTDETFTNGLTTFTCLISNNTGSFASSQSVVAVLNGSNFIIPALPNNLPTSNAYKIKIQANNPSVLSSESATFEIVSLPNTPGISPLHLSSSPLEVCLNSPTTFNITNAQAGITYKWGWDFGYLAETSTSMTSNNSIGGSYNYWVEAFKSGTENTCEGVRSDYTYVSVSDLSPFVSTEPSTSFTQCPGGNATLTFNGYAGAGPFTYQWISGLSPISGETGLTYNPTTSGDYSLRIEKNGCFGTSTPLTVTFSGSPISANFTAPLANNILCFNSTVTVFFCGYRRREGHGF